MRRLSLFTGIMLIACFQLTHAQDIFKQHGFDKMPLTLSDGRYIEFFKNDEVVQIGTVLLNTKTNKVVAFVEEDNVKAKYLAEFSSRWLSIDPLAAKYSQFSPYVYVANNPINAVDPDGRLIIFVNGFRAGKSAGEVYCERNGISSHVYKSDKFNYWGSMDESFKNKIKDNNSLYVDASMGISSSAKERYANGLRSGQDMLNMIKYGDITLKKNDAGKIIETIKIVAHSQGSAEAPSEASILIKAGYKVEVIYNISPKQPGDIQTPTEVDRVVQYGSGKDMVAPQSQIPGVDESIKMSNDDPNNGVLRGHYLDNYKWIFRIGEGNQGEVKAGIDVEKK